MDDHRGGHHAFGPLVRACPPGGRAPLRSQPYYHRLSDPAIEEYFCKLAMATPDLPFFVYNYPDASGATVSFDMFQSLLALPNVAGVKHSVGTFEELEPYLSLPRDVCVMAGNDSLSRRFLRSGGRAIVSGNAAAFPEVMSRLVDAVLDDPDADTDDLMARVDVVVALGRSGAPDRLRELLRMRGVEVGRSRLATYLPAEISEEHATLARDLVAELAD